VHSLNAEYLLEEVKEVAETVKKIRLRLDEENVSLGQYLDQGVAKEG